jgi:flavin reductase (DIM6/NTAB) family NADH-FMN oxidoreductase RutF
MPITSESFRDALRFFPAGVTIVTIKSPLSDAVHGLTVSAFTSVSPDPPLILVSIDHRAKGCQLLDAPGACFAVNILARNQMELSNRFAWLKDEDRFAEGDWGAALTGAPILKDALAWLDCTVHAKFSAGSHTIYFGEVQASGIPRPNDTPLIYWNRGYRQLKRK